MAYGTIFEGYLLVLPSHPRCSSALPPNSKAFHMLSELLYPSTMLRHLPFCFLPLSSSRCISLFFNLHICSYKNYEFILHMYMEPLLVHIYLLKKHVVHQSCTVLHSPLILMHSLVGKHDFLCSVLCPPLKNGILCTS